MKENTYDFMKSLLYCTLTSISLLLGTSVGADDTEIFIGGGSNSGGVQPNVLFILDSSGSMSGSVFDENGNRSPYSRMENMKMAFEEVMNNISGVNVGLMTFTGSGGYIMYPVTDVDTILASEDELESSIGMLSGLDDAVELKTSGHVYTDDETLTIAHTPNREASRSIVAFLAHEDDDIEEYSSGYITNNHSQFNMGYGQKNALRYYDLGIPQGATIVSAHVEFTASQNNDNHLMMRISGEDADNPSRFGTSRYTVTNKLTNRTTAHVDWEMFHTDNWVYGRQYNTPDLGPIIQEIVNRGDWDPNDALVLLFEHTGGTPHYGHRAGTLRRDDRSNTQGLNGSGSLLHITYTTAVAPVTDQIVGLRFSNIAIPAGATVTNARIDFVSAAANTTADALNIQVTVENTGNAEAFDSTTNNLSNRTKFSDVVTWHPDDSWDFGQTIEGPNVTSLVQRVVSDNSDWCGNNAMAFFLEPSTASDTMSRLAYAYEAGAGQKPTLTVSYTGGENGCIRRLWSERVNTSENDAHQSGSGNADNDRDYLYFDSNNYVGLRFENVDVTQGYEVSDAYLEITAYRNDTGHTTINIAGHDTANAPAFPQSKRNISNRTLTTNDVDWDVSDWVGNTTYRSPDISHIINEILARGDWQAGNALALIMETNNSDTRYMYAQDGSSGKAARLVFKAAPGAIAHTTNTVRSHETDLVNSLVPRSLTPATGSYYEAAQYYLGGQVDYGKDRGNSRYNRVSHSDSWTGGTLVRNTSCTDDNLGSSACSNEHISGSPTYISPITSACQSSHIVLLTDGAANNNTAASKIASLTGVSDCANDGNQSGENCARTLAHWMANTDMMPSLTGSTNTVSTHTVAFNLSSPNAVNFLEELASEGNGGFYNVSTSSQLATAFDSIIQNIRSTASTFVAPGATVNQFNRLSHRAEVYFSVFKPDATPRWAGNLKRYKLLGNPAVISDANDKAAVDNDTGFFKETAQSVWSESIDGAVVSSGGAANQRPLHPDDLNIYTWLQSASARSNDLTADVNHVHESNHHITTAMTGAADSTDHTALLQWIRGVDTLDADNDSNTTEVRQEYADPLHSVPRIITYGGSNENPDTTIYFGTNGGYLHAIDGTTGEEIFSFIPESQFGHMKTRRDNTARFTHPYGVDGSPTSWVYDANNDNQINASDGDFAYLYFGLRRGGNEYFALDVTHRDKPTLLWHIEGGSGDFSELGQTWSTPVFSKIRYGDVIRDVLVFGGGYNTAFDTAHYASATTTGNAIYVVDARTGERLWYASSSATSGDGQRLSDLQYPIPSDISVVDINGDGLAEQLYTADLFGQIFRFDINTLGTHAHWIQGGLIADLGASSAPNNRRFFNAPDISLTSITKTQKLAIAIGSGSRPTPLSRATQDRFYVVLQDSIFRAPTSYDVMTTSDLVDQSSNITALTDAHQGWYFDLPNSGEKVLSPSITVANKIVFTTYSPDSSASSCNPVVGTGRAYVINLRDASAVTDLDEDDELEAVHDRSKTLASGNIPPSPKVLFPDDGAPTVLVGPEQPLGNIDLGLVDEWTQIYRRPEDPD